MAEIGKSVVESAHFIAKIGEQVESMVELITDNLSNSFGKIAINFIPVGDWRSCTRYDENDWVLSDYVYYIGLKFNRKNQVKPAGYLNIQISLWQDGAEFEGNEEPLLHICWWDDPISVDKEDNYFGSLFGDDEEFEIESNVLINWKPLAETIPDQRWSYSLFLTSINDLNDIRKKIVSPVIDLFAKGIKEAVSSITDLDGIVKYERSSDLPKRSLKVIRKS